MISPKRRIAEVARRRGSASTPLSIPAAQFKAECLALMDQVNRTGEEIIVTKHRRAVAKLVSARTPVPSRPFFGRARGMIQVAGDIVAPLGPDWTVDADY